MIGSPAVYAIELKTPLTDVGASDASGGREKSPGKFDWFIGVSPTIIDREGVTRDWADLEFPGRHPRRAGTDSRTFCPSEGYARAALMSWDSRKPMRELLKVFLEDFLHQNGYYDCDGAIQDILDAFAAVSS